MTSCKWNKDRTLSWTLRVEERGREQLQRWCWHRKLCVSACYGEKMGRTWKRPLLLMILSGVGGTGGIYVSSNHSKSAAGLNPTGGRGFSVCSPSPKTHVWGIGWDYQLSTHFRWECKWGVGCLCFTLAVNVFPYRLLRPAAMTSSCHWSATNTTLLFSIHTCILSHTHPLSIIVYHTPFMYFLRDESKIKAQQKQLCWRHND